MRFPAARSFVRLPPPPPLLHPRPFVHHPLLVSLPSTHTDDARLFFGGRFDIDTLYPRRIHYRLAEQYTRQCITPAHPPTIRWPLLSLSSLLYRRPAGSIYAIVIYDIANYFRKACPKMRDGCIKFLNSAMTRDLSTLSAIDAVDARQYRDPFSAAYPANKLHPQKSAKVNFTSWIAAKKKGER